MIKALPGFEKVIVRTRFLPTVEYDVQGPSSPFSQKLEKILKPSVELQIAGRRYTVYQPYGDPGETMFPLVAVGVGFLALLGFQTLTKRLSS